MRFTQIINVIAAGSLAGIAAAVPMGTRTLDVAKRGVALGSRATNAVVTNSAVAVKTINDSTGKSSGTDSYTMYTGDGSTQDGWPAKSDWLSFDELWKVNKASISESCSNNGWGADNSATETQDIYDAINEVAKESEVDHRLILAVVMQESKGCVRVPTTANSVSNPGLMQSYEGTGTCYGKSTCPKSEIVQMIRDGAVGTASGDGYATLINLAKSNTVAAYYKSARLYNSGINSLESSDNLSSSSGATSCYASDVANRLTGWVTAATKCTSS
ncbi:hypothetical protein BO71DRAFT_448025 [Aspergillus ellipticus CBS 707.79]|uniref:Muramidase n=1 Tax=Aspergillus ellipticus CBS 707.79 TaxID=1448320 RepID=A0A319DIB3_9EURO|nr:hypothetical protein BO71DRAFT_448025 [Aspergillus ellipticus CBS 707.79]